MKDPAIRDGGIGNHRPKGGQIYGRCAKEKGGIPAVVCLPMMTMQLPK